MILIELKGGLGNQLFIIFACLNYALKYDKKFMITQNIYTEKICKELKRYTYWDSIFKKIAQFAIPVGECYGQYKKLILETSYTFTPLPFYEEKTYIRGYFQSHKYYTENYEKIVKMLDINKQREEVKGKYKFDYNNICSIHFRYGDYKKNPDYHHLLKSPYYVNAVKYILEKQSIKKFLIFYEKEDTENVKSIVKEFNKKVNDVIFIDTKIPDYEQILIMSNCFSNIIANSTFSFWGATFNDNPKKVVIYPKKWFGPKAKNDTKDLCPDNWISL